MISGGDDYSLRFWDFPNMTQMYKSFRMIQPIEGQPLKSASFNNSGQKIFVSGGSAKPKLLTRDGKEIIEFLRGDMYISDVCFSRGHIGNVTSGQWHTIEDHLIITTSLDSSIRIWDVNAKPFGIEEQLASIKCIRCKNGKGTKTGVYTCGISPDGKLIGAGCEDGSYQFFSDKNQYNRPVHEYRRENGPEVTDIRFFSDNVTFVSRAYDNTMRIFDLRNFKQPVYTWYDLYNNSSYTSICLSPNEKYILTGISNTKSEPGYLYICSSSSGDGYKELGKIPIGYGKPTGILWPEQLNQIIVGAGNDIKIFYDPKLSERGAMLGAVRKEREKHAEDIEYKRPVFTPHALALFNENHKYRRKNYEEEREDPK